MQTAAEAVVDYLREAEPCVTLASSRPAQAYFRVISPDEMLTAITMKGDFAEIPTRVAKPAQTLSVDPSPADQAIAQILRLEQLGADWDGNDASEPSAESLKQARSFIRLLAPESRIPRPTLHADGHMILFVREPDIYAEIEFLDHNMIGYYVRRGEDKWTGEIFFNGQALPDGLSQIGLSL